MNTGPEHLSDSFVFWVVCPLISSRSVTISSQQLIKEMKYRFNKKEFDHLCNSKI
jgi:hypothetical protein